MTSEAITAAASGTWKIGDLEINRIGFGAMRLTQNGEAFAADAAPSDRGRAISVLRRAVELGVNHIDTAAFYFSPRRSANELINRALAPYPDDLVITTKVGPGRDPSGEWLPHATSQQLRAQLEENLRRVLRSCRSTPSPDELLAVARAHEASAAQVRLAWTLHRGPHVLAIPGTGNPDHLVANVAADTLRLTQDELAVLDRLHQGGASA
ncbi:aldo/keto reductase [Streptomyces inhibens]|uniref:aldo/keto reductase n=1 Tax=Streptomyces inhibens TaxID=2293571 RepID=UPI001EE778F9|nr:aldo/keto reductase [Streptomyces inhibens]UKY47509.1 aldo/keto reductase [Streptomyces inhibens]